MNTRGAKNLQELVVVRGSRHTALPVWNEEDNPVKLFYLDVALFVKAFHLEAALDVADASHHSTALDLGGDVVHLVHLWHKPVQRGIFDLDGTRLVCFFNANTEHFLEGRPFFKMVQPAAPYSSPRSVEQRIVHGG